MFVWILKSTVRLELACYWLQTPLHRYAKLLSLKARQQQALRRTGLVKTDKAAGPDEGDEANSSMDEEEDENSGDISLHEAQERRKTRKPLKIEEPIKDSPMYSMRVRNCFQATFSSLFS